MLRKTIYRHLESDAAHARAIRNLRNCAIVAVILSEVMSAIGMRDAEATTRRDNRRSEVAWTAEEVRTLKSLSLASLGPLAPDASNRVADDNRAAALGKALFFDKQLSGNGKVSCASCHEVEKSFQDGKSLASGMGTTTRRTMPIAGTAYSPWQFWDGRADSQWAQALGPLESAVEHGGSRTQYAHEIVARYYSEYSAVFGPLPKLDGLPRNAGPVSDTAALHAWQRIPASRQADISRIYANIGKAIAAYERRITIAPSRFDRYVDTEVAGLRQSDEAILSRDEAQGLRLFIGKANCINCHNGARFTDDHFHNTGVSASRTVTSFDSGRTVGARQVVAGEFNCMSRYSDAKPDDCSELRFAVTEGKELIRAFKTPSLRGVAERAPYMHAGQLATLADVVVHYDRAPRALAGHTELKALQLSPNERRQIELFLRTLSSPLNVP